MTLMETTQHNLVKNMKLLMPILFYVLLTQTKSSVEIDLSDERDGYCTFLVSQINTRNVLYYETYQKRVWGMSFGTGIRPNYRIEHYTTWRTERRCCVNYEKQGGKCIPICSKDCGNGDCISPGNCRCWAGYKESSSFIGPVCVPFCKNTCVHGTCTSPDVCTCEKGYSIKSNGFICEPDCYPNCDSKTAFCSKPNICTCRNGYKMDLTSCKPVCTLPCINGTCTAPDTCTCDQGYSLDINNRFNCNPVCDKCVDGTCTAPNVCTCPKGFSLNNESVCKPVCNKVCHNGTCIAPDICMCHEGYGFRNNSTNICEPVCYKACINGFCTKPNVCMCHEGYEVTGDETSLHVCKPHCNMLCEPNGECTGPNICTCHEGYSLVGEDDNENIYFGETSVCKPVCKKKCINGICIAPDYCTCSRGYKPSDNEVNVCEPICEPSCWSHSTCTNINECTCDTGYKLIKATDNTTHACEPICEEECINGFCSAPNECSCNAGYQEIKKNVQKKHAYECEPICEEACPSNGICQKPNLCECKDGYLLTKSNGSIFCEPICEIHCGNGTCISPNTCSCDIGYVNDENSSCIPFCSVDCGNGTCIEPEICDCDEGYIFLNENQTCQPYCQNGCGNGDCVAPDDCRCHSGFIKNGNDTGSICINPCKNSCNKNGICINDQGECDCHYGWTGISCEEPTVCIVVVLEEHQAYERLSLENKSNNSMLLASASNPTCQQCLKEINNTTLCYKSLYDEMREGNNSAICFVNTSSMCYATHDPRKGLKIGFSVGGISILIMILVITTACYKFRKGKRQCILNKEF